MKHLSHRRSRTSARAVILAAGLALAAPGLAFAMGSSSESGDEKSYKDAVKAVEAKDFDKAVTLLTTFVADHPKRPDAYNYLGYSLRNLGRNEESMTNYQKALTLDPKHKGALEYQGELYLKMGQPAAAEANLVKLVAVCGRTCAERDALQAAIERAKDGKTSFLEPQRAWKAGG